mgnify:CR=1 FL=1
MATKRTKLQKEIYKRGYNYKTFCDEAGLSLTCLARILNKEYKKVRGSSIYNMSRVLEVTYEEMEEILDE